MSQGTVTGERVTTSEGGFGPTWQRHVAAYSLCASLLGPGKVLDLGCGVGHSWRLLAPRKTVGVDLEADVLRGQDRETHVADMRELLFPDASFDSVLSVQSLEHVPDPESVLAEAARVLVDDGTAIFVTPNRLTFGRPDEIIDPYHYVEFSSAELADAAEYAFEDVTLLGLHGSARYLKLVEEERRRLESLLRKDPLRARRAVPRRARQVLYDWILTRSRRRPAPTAQAVGVGDFSLDSGRLDECLDLVAICVGPRR